jgi:hypothetical protein
VELDTSAVAISARRLMFLDVAYLRPGALEADLAEAPSSGNELFEPSSERLLRLGWRA